MGAPENIPILRIPHEILGEILLMCTDAHPEPDPDSAPILFTRISRWFRHVALTTPRLWSSICLLPSDRERCLYDRPGYLDLISDWLVVRSGTTPLNITFKDEIGWYKPSTAAFLAVIFSCKARWEDISLQMDRGLPLFDIAELNETDVPYLRTLSLDDPARSPDDCFANSRIFMAPNLRRLQLRFSTPFALNADMSWTQLTHVHLLSFVGPFIKFLAQAEALTHLHFLTTSLGDDNIAQSTVSLPSLIGLEIKGPWNVDIRSLLGYLNTPRLESLQLLCRLENHPVTPLVDHIRRTPHLKHLYVRNIDYDSMISILRCTPDLEMLQTSMSTALAKEQSNEFLDTFVVEDNDGRMQCPQLEMLHCESELDPDDETLLRLYERKLGSTPGVCAWSDCCLIFKEERSADIVDELTGGERHIWEVFTS